MPTRSYSSEAACPPYRGDTRYRGRRGTVVPLYRQCADDPLASGGAGPRGSCRKSVPSEVLRTEYFQQHFDDLKKLFDVPDTVRALPRAPELLTCLALRMDNDKVPYFVYPDPPLAKQELDLLIELDPNLRLTTPTLLFAKPSQPLALAGQNLEKAAAGWRIGLSISDSADLGMRGFGPAHLRDAASEFARFLLAAGATLAYGE